MSKLLIIKGKQKQYACADCQKAAAYFSKYDTFACLHCDQWLDICSCGPQDGCPFEKPTAKPSQENPDEIEFVGNRHENKLSPASRKMLEAGLTSGKTEPTIDLGSFRKYNVKK